MSFLTQKKKNREKINLLLSRMKNLMHGLGMHSENHEKKKAFFRRYALSYGVTSFRE